MGVMCTLSSAGLEVLLSTLGCRPGHMLGDPGEVDGLAQGRMPRDQVSRTRESPVNANTLPGSPSVAVSAAGKWGTV